MAKKLTTEDLVLNIIVNANKAQSEIGKVSRALVDAKSKLTQAESEMKKLEKAGQTNSARYQQLQRDVKNYNTTIDDSKRRLTELNQTLSLQDKSLKQLETSLRRTRQLWRQATNDNDRQRYASEMDQLNKRISELRQGGEQTGNALLRMSQNIQKYFAVITAGIASFMAVFSGIKKATDDYAKFDDILADVMKTTDLTKDSVKELNAELEKIDTRTSQEDLLGLGRIAGKLGYKDITEITEFVRANNQIIVALNEDLGGNVEETVNKIGKLVEIFKLRDLYETEEAFLKVGSAINELGMASTANEGYMVEFARRMSGIAPLAGVSIEQILGLGATLDQLGQTAEVSSTALSKLFLAVAKDAETYSKYAGMSVKDFKDLLEKDFMGAFTKVLEGVRGSSEGINQLAATLGDLGQDGGRVIGVIGSLANNVDILTGSIELSNKAMAEGTSVTDEFNIKNETAAAQLDRARKESARLWRELGERLWPAMTQGLNIWSMFVEILITTIKFISENIKTITVLTVSIVAYYTAVQIAAKWEAITTAAMVAKRIVMTGLVVAYGLMTGSITRAAAAQQLLNLRIMANPYGLAAAALAGLITYLVLFSNKTDESVKSQTRLRDAIGKASVETEMETRAIQSAVRVLNDNTESLERKLDVVKTLRATMPGVLQDYTDEQILAGEATKAILNQAQAIQLRAKARAIEELIKEEEMARIERDNKMLEGYANQSFWTRFKHGFEGMFSNRSGMQVWLDDFDEGTSNSAKNLDLFNKELDSTLQKIAQVDQVINPFGGGTGTGGGNGTGSDKERRAAYKKELEAAEKFYQERLQKEGLFREDISELTNEQLEKMIEYHNQYQNTLDAINKKYGENLKTVTNAAEKELKKRLFDQDKYRKEVLLKEKSLIEQEEHAHEERLRNAGIFEDDKTKLVGEKKAVYEALLRQHNANIDKIEDNAIAVDLDRQKKAYEQELTVLKTKHNTELSEITTLEQAKDYLRGSFSDKELAQVKTLAQARKLIQNQQFIEEENLTKEHLQNLAELLKQAIATGGFGDYVLSDEQKEALKERLLEVEKSLSDLFNFDRGDELADSARRRVDILGMSAGDWEDLFKNVGTTEERLNRVYGAIDAVMGAFSSYASLVAQKENAMLHNDQQANERKKENLRKRLDDGTLSQESYNQQIEKMDRDMDKKRAELAHKQAKREKAIALMGAIVNTARAVTAALPNLILAALVGAMGAVQIGTIASTPLPQVEGRATGGRFDVERAQDGRKFSATIDPDKRGYVSNPTVLVGESGKEWVANNEMVTNPFTAPIIDWLDTVQRQGQINPSMLSHVVKGTIPGRQSGGTFSGSSGAGAPAPIFDDRVYKTLDRLDKTMSNLDHKLTNLKAEVSLLGKNGFIEKMDEYTKIQDNANL